ncbi:MAG: Methyltransferase [Candidatus Tokpelaia sp. JSC188]|nr:MAG: Methyltransferase [Candidatus Tokpelaia sp. JSC188]
MIRNSKIFDSRLIEHFRLRAFRKATAGIDFLAALMAKDLEVRLATIDRYFTCAIDLHGHTGLAANAMAHSGKVAKIKRIETSAEFLTQHYPSVICPREKLSLNPQQADLIVSLLSLHMTNDILSVLVQIKNGLKPDGLFLSVMCGNGTLGELRECLLQAENELYGGVHPRVFPFADIRDAGTLLQQAGFAIPVTDIENIIVRYNTAFDLIADLRAMGIQNTLLARSRQPVSRRFFIRVAEIYAQHFSDPDGRIRATFSFIWMSGWTPHINQQKPMKPGTAQMSFAKILSPIKREK